MLKLHKYLILIIINFLTGVLFLSCDGQYDSRLLEIERVMILDTDSVSRLLTEYDLNLNPSTLSTPDRHLYELLRADHRYFADTKDTVNIKLKEAIQYFEDNNEYRRASRANFLMGDICASANKNLEAIGYLLSSYDYAAAIRDTLALALADRGIADCYGRMNDWGNAISYHKQSLDLFKAIGDSIYTPWEYYSLADGFIFLGEYDKAKKYTTEFCKIGHQLNRQDILKYSYELFIRIAGESHNPEMVFQYLDSLRHLPSTDLSVIEIEYEGLAALETHQEILAGKCLDTLYTTNGGSGMLEMQWNIYHDDYKKAFENLKDMLKFHNETVYQLIRREYASTLNTHYEEKVKRNALLHKREKQSSMLALSISLALILGLIIAIIFYHRRLRSIRIDKEVALDQFNADLAIFTQNESKILNDLKQKNEEVFELEKRNEELDKSVKSNRDTLREQLLIQSGWISGFIENYDAIKDTPDKNKLRNKLDKHILLLSSKAYTKEFEEQANRRFENIMHRFDLQCGKINHQGRLLFLYHVLCFPASLQILLLNVDSTKLSNRKYYLKKKIMDSNAPNKEEFLYFINNP